MPPSRKSTPCRSRRTLRPDHPLHVTVIAALAAIGWRVVEIRPDETSVDSALWRVTIERVDAVMSMTTLHPGPDAGLEELFRYASADRMGRP